MSLPFSRAKSFPLPRRNHYEPAERPPDDNATPATAAFVSHRPNKASTLPRVLDTVRSSKKMGTAQRTTRTR